MERGRTEQPENIIEKRGWEIEHAEEVIPDGWRLTYPGAGLDVPESWAFYNGEELVVIDPGGEMPVETPADKNSLRGFARAVTRTAKTPKLDALHELEKKYETKVGAILLTHGDADHQNDIEYASEPEAPVYVGKKGRWSVLSPEKQFIATRVNMDKSSLTGNKSSRVLFGRDVGFQTTAHLINNQRSTNFPGPQRAARKRVLAKRLRDFPESFDTNAGKLKVVALPGHAPEEVGFYLPDQKIMITGDLIGTSKAGQSGRMNLFLGEANVYDAITSLKTLEQMDIERLYPAHGPPIVGQDAVHEHLSRVRADAEALVQHILDLREQYPKMTVQKLCPLVFTAEWKREGMVVQSQETWIWSALKDKR